MMAKHTLSLCQLHCLIALGPNTPTKNVHERHRRHRRRRLIQLAPISSTCTLNAVVLRSSWNTSFPARVGPLGKMCRRASLRRRRSFDADERLSRTYTQPKSPCRVSNSHTQTHTHTVTHTHTHKRTVAANNKRWLWRARTRASSISICARCDDLNVGTMSGRSGTVRPHRT